MQLVSGAAGQLASRGFRPPEESADVVERVAEHVVEDERHPFGGSQRVHNHLHRSADLVGEHRILRRIDRWRAGWRARLDLGSGRSPAKVIQAQARDNSGQPGRQRVDLVGVAAGQPEPRFLDHVTGVVLRPEDPRLRSPSVSSVQRRTRSPNSWSYRSDAPHHPIVTEPPVTLAGRHTSPGYEQHNTSGASRRHTRWIGPARDQPRARTIAAVLTGFCGLVALVSATGKLTNQAAVVELLDHVEVHGVLRDLLPVLQIAGGLGALVSLDQIPETGRRSADRSGALLRRRSHRPPPRRRRPRRHRDTPRLHVVMSATRRPSWRNNRHRWLSAVDASSSEIPASRPTARTPPSRRQPRERRPVP